MKIIIFTNYFPPELGAASNRIFYLAKGLKDHGHQVEVVAPLPNYPKGKIFEKYSGKFKTVENIEGIIAHRYWIYPTVSKNPVARALGMFSFALSMWLGLLKFRKMKPDLVIVQQSPLLVSYSAIMMAKSFMRRTKRVLNVSDIWPLSAFELGAIKKGRMYSLLERIEHSNYRNSALIMGQSEEILTHVGKRCRKPLVLYRNIYPINLEKTGKRKDAGKLKIVYAGLLGVAQGVYNICSRIDFSAIGAEFHIYGSGNEEAEIRDFVATHSEAGIYFHGSLPKEELYKILPSFHASIVPLAHRIYGAVPSKIYELILFQIPILFCGGGEGAQLIEENHVGYTSAPADIPALQQNIQKMAELNSTEYQELLDNCFMLATSKLSYQMQIENLNDAIRKLKKEE